MTRSPVLLVIEDDESDLIFLKRAFQKIGLTVPVRVVETGLKAVHYLAGEGDYADRDRFPAPTHVLMDLKLPEKSGIEILEWVRGRPDLQELKVAILTSSGESRDLKRARELGAECYLVKPMSFAVLVELSRSVESWIVSGQCPSASPWFHERAS